MDIAFDSSSLLKPDGYARWTDLVCRSICRTETRLVSTNAFSARFQRRALGDIELGEIACTPLQYMRTPQDVCSAPNRDFQVSMLVEGQGALSQADRNARMGPGEIVIYDSGKPFQYDFPQPYRLLHLQVPRDLMLHYVPAAERLTCMPVGSHSTIGTMAAGLMRESAALHVPKGTSWAHKIGTSILEMLAAAMEAEFCATSVQRDSYAALRERAKSYMRAHISDPQLDLNAIAHALCTTARTLSRAFAAEGLTVGRWLWSERLNLSYHALADARSTQIAAVALNYGFSNFSHFSRAFRSRFGHAPSALRKKPQSAAELAGSDLKFVAQRQELVRRGADS